MIRAKEEELKRGQAPDGGIIGTYRSKAYQLFKQRKNPLAKGFVDLILTGAVKRGLKIIALGNGIFEFVSTDQKWGDLVAKYGKKIKGLNQIRFNRLQRERHRPMIVSFINKKLGR